MWWKTWFGSGPNSDNFDVYANRFNAAGVAQQAPGQPPGTSEFRVNSTVTHDQGFPAAAMDGAGNFVMTFTGFGQDPGDQVRKDDLYQTRIAFHLRVSCFIHHLTGDGMGSPDQQHLFRR